MSCQSFNAIYIKETGSTLNIRLKEHKNSFKSDIFNSKIVVRALEHNQHNNIPDFANAQIIKPNSSIF